MKKPTPGADKARGRRGARRRRERTVRTPAARAASRLRKRFELEKRDPEQQKKIDELLVRVYQQAAREIRGLEAQRVIELRERDRGLAATYAEARAELMDTLRRWRGSIEGGDCG